MTPNSARMWLLTTTLIFTTGILVFFLLAPALGYPLEFAQSMRQLEIVLPIFLGYLGSAGHFVFRSHSAQHEPVFDPTVAALVPILVIGPLIVFGLGVIAIIVAFGLMNGKEAGPGMSIDQFSLALSTVLGLLTATTNLAVSYLFRSGPHGKTL